MIIVKTATSSSYEYEELVAVFSVIVATLFYFSYCPNKWLSE